MAKLVGWTVEEEMRFLGPLVNPDYNSSDSESELENSRNSPFSIAKIKDEEFSFKTTNSFFGLLRIHGLESATIEILHERKDSDVHLCFQAENTNGWGEYKSLDLEVSFKSKDNCGESGNTEGIWKVVKSFAISLQNRNGLPYKGSLYFLKELCKVDDLLMDYQTDRNLGFKNYQLKLPIRVSVKVSEEDVSIRISNTDPMDLMKKLLFERLHSDFYIQVGEMAFACHKSILAGKSAVFAAMLDSKISEATSQVVKIEDMSPAGVEAFLKYLYYKNEVPVSNCAIALELLKAGHKYQVKELELECRKILSTMPEEKFDAKTAFELFEFSGMLEGFKIGQTKAARVFKENAAKYFESEEFEAVMLVKPKIVANLFKTVALI